MVDQRFWARQRVLVLAPHPDDETFGCAGLMAKVKAAGGRVFVIVASVGDLRHYGVAPVAAGRRTTRVLVAGGRSEGDGPEMARVLVAGPGSGGDAPEMALVTGEQRAAELAAAMAVLGVDGYEILFNDAHRHLRLDAMPQRDLIAMIERDSAYAIDRVVPTVLVLPARTYNQDHDALFRAGFAACRPHLPGDRPFVSLVLSCDSPQHGWTYRPFRANFYVDISAHLQTKLRAHACHLSQLKPPPHHSSLEAVERLARLRGTEISVDAAEAFQCHRVVF